jgi:hypothetical protein
VSRQIGQNRQQNLLWAGLSHRLPMLTNLLISNVPGLQVPLFMAGAKMVTFHPMSIVVHGVALNITVQTYAGHVDFGVVAARTALPHVHDFTEALLQAFDECKTRPTLASDVTKVMKPKRQSAQDSRIQQRAS